MVDYTKMTDEELLKLHKKAKPKKVKSDYSSMSDEELLNLYSKSKPVQKPKKVREKGFTWEGYTQTLLPTAGAVIGGIFGNIPGAMAGAGAGNILSQGISNIAHQRGGFDPMSLATDVGASALGGIAGKGLSKVAMPLAKRVAPKATQTVTGKLLNVKTGQPYQFQESIDMPKFVAPDVWDVMATMGGAPQVGLTRALLRQPVMQRGMLKAGTKTLEHGMPIGAGGTTLTKKILFD